MPPALLCGVWGPGPLICGDVLWREPPCVITLLPIAAAATEPPASAGPYSPRWPAAPPTAQTQGTPLLGPNCPFPANNLSSLPPPTPASWERWSRPSRGLSLGQGPESLYIFFWSEYIPHPHPPSGNQTQDRTLGTRLELRNIWTGLTPVQTRSQLRLELPATLIPEKKILRLSFFFFFSLLFLFLNHQFTYLL